MGEPQRGEDFEEPFQLGLPFTTQDIEELARAPDYEGKRRGWAGYTKDGYCSRSVDGVDLAYLRIAFEASRARNVVYPWIYEHLVSTYDEEEKVMEDCYVELKEVVRRLQAKHWYPFHEVYWAYKCLKFNALYDALANALSVQRRIARIVADLEKQRQARNSSKLEGEFGRFILESVISTVIEDDLLPSTGSQHKLLWLYARDIFFRSSNLPEGAMEPSLTPKNLNIAFQVEARWLSKAAWMTGMNDEILSLVWQNTMRAAMLEPIDAKAPFRYVTQEELPKRNGDGMVRTVRLNYQRLRTRKFPARTRSCGPKLSSAVRRHTGWTTYRDTQPPDHGWPPELLSYRKTHPNLFNLDRVRDLERWEDFRTGMQNRRIRREWDSDSAQSDSGDGSDDRLTWERTSPDFSDYEQRTLFNWGCLIMGWFPGNKNDPKEMCIRFGHNDQQRFFHDLYLHIMVLRGWRHFFSFKTVQGFGVYKCEVTKGAHAPHPTSPAENTTLAQLFQVYNKSSSDGRENRAWCKWCCDNLGSDFFVDAPCESQLSLKLILKWSQRRLICASLVPLMLSLVIGMWYHLYYDDPQSAYTIASYIGSSGTFIIALLAVLTQLKDG